MTRIRVDFNSVDGHGHIRSSLSRADGPADPGDTVTAYDTEGNQAEAVVVSRSDRERITLRIDPSTWVERHVTYTAAAGLLTKPSTSAIESRRIVRTHHAVRSGRREQVTAVNA